MNTSCNEVTLIGRIATAPYDVSAKEHQKAIRLCLRTEIYQNGYPEDFTIPVIFYDGEADGIIRCLRDGTIKMGDTVCVSGYIIPSAIIYSQTDATPIDVLKIIGSSWGVPCETDDAYEHQ
ncbi:MAG: hypothetical protein Q4C50_04895 [Eubacteriales bacterium]|nr:hypothetical protein [Eubacteriales bacterium]